MGLFSEKKKISIRDLSLYYRDDEPWVAVDWRERGDFGDPERRQAVNVKLENLNKENVLETIGIALAQRREEDEKKFREK